MAETIPPDTNRKTALAPDLRRLDDRSVRAWVERMAVRPLGDTAYVVESESGATYVVDAVNHTCTCPDHQIRGETCKHMRRVAIEITSRRVPPPGKRRTVCAACGARTDVPTDTEPPALCAHCLLEPGDVVQDRETGDRLVVARVTADRADEVVIPAANCTVADYETNEGYPPDDPVVEAVYLGDLPRRPSGQGDLHEGLRSPTVRRYSFPLSRLDRVEDAALVG